MPTILKVANVHFTQTGNNRLEYTGAGIVRLAANGLQVPVGTSDQRPDGEAGIIRYNSTLGAFESHNGSGWSNVVTGVIDLTPANNWANTISQTRADASNAYTVSVGAAANAYTVSVGAAANALSLTRATASNTYAQTVGTAGNNYTITVGAAANNWANTITGIIFNSANVAVKNNATTLITVGYTANAANKGTISSGTFTPNLAEQNRQYYTNNGAHTLAAPTSDGDVDVWILNGASAGSISFTGFTTATDNRGDPLTTTNEHRFIISIRRVNSISTFIIKALQ